MSRKIQFMFMKVVAESLLVILMRSWGYQKVGIEIDDLSSFIRTLEQEITE